MHAFPDKPPSHLLPLADGWLIWKTIALRGAGFPVDLLEQLAAPRAAAVVDSLLDAEALLEEAAAKAIGDCRAGLDACADSEKPLWRKAIRRLAKRRPPDVERDHVLAPILERVRLAQTAVEAAGVRVAEALAGAERDIWRFLRRLCDAPDFREAIAWQNRAFLKGGMESFRRRGWEASGAARRRNERTVAGYLQRYAAKNDTIGFFGPLGWAHLVPGGLALRVQPGRSLVCKRVTRPEFWCVDALARRFADNPEIRRWLPPRLSPRWRFSDNDCVDANGISWTPSAEERRLLQAVDGVTPAHRIAAEFSGSADENLRSLQRLAESGVVLWNADVPVAPDALQRLRQLVSRGEAGGARDQALAEIDEILGAQASLSEASGDAAGVESALSELERRFRRITGKSAQRLGGQTYAGRTLVNQDCQRDIEVSIGLGLLDQLGPSLALVVRSARWFAASVAERFSEFLETEHAAMSKRFSDEPPPLSLLVLENPRIQSQADEITAQVRRLLQDRWRRILNYDSKGAPRQYDSAALQDEVHAAFPDRRPPWPNARFHSPDVLIAARDPQDVAAGRFQFVLGEIHPTTNTITQPSFFELHPRPQNLKDWLSADLARPQIQAVVSRERVGSLVVPVSVLPDDIDVAVDGTPSWRAPENVLSVAELLVEKTARGLEIVTRDRRRRFQLCEFFRPLVGTAITTGFALVPDGVRCPRLTIDNLVIQREQWTRPSDEIPFAIPKDRAERFIGARRWQREQRMPRQVFVRVATEAKPIYLDFDSPISVDIAAKMIHQSESHAPGATVEFREMLPVPDDCWLSDAQGNRYTSELRMACVDAERF